MEKIREEEAKKKEQEEKERKEKEEEKKKETTQDKIDALKEKLASVQRSNRRSPEIQKLGKQIEELQIKRDGERLTEIEEELKPLPRYGPEAAALKLEKEEIEERQQKRKEAEEEAKNKELKIKNEKMKTNKARDDKTSGRKTPEKVKQGGRTTSANNVRIHK